MSGQVMKFGATVLECLPELTTARMQELIESPTTLAELLNRALCPPAPVRRWREENGVIRFELTANGWSGKQWVDYFKINGVGIGEYGRQVLLSSDFKVTPAGTVVKVAVLKGEIFSDSDRVTGKIRDYATEPQRKLATPNTDLACLVRKDLTNKEVREMGLYWIVGMSEPVKDSGGGPVLLYLDCDGSDSWLDARYDDPGNGWDRDCGFAFVEQVSSED